MLSILATGNEVKTVFGEARNAAGETRVKICGLTSLGDALAALEAGADALGFNFYPKSPRYLQLAEAQKWLGKLQTGVPKIAVLVNPTIEDAIRFAQLPFLDALQLHGDESPSLCRVLADQGHRFIKAIGVSEEASISEAASFSTRTVLLDSRSAGFGGSGQTFPWEIAQDLVKERPDLQVFLAGGLTEENVVPAIRQVHPFGVDVTSGVESSPGRKDPARMKAFIAAVRAIPG